MWNWDTTPFIQVTWAGVEAPVRHTVSEAGAAELDDADDGEPEPQPATANAAVAQSATAASPAGLVWLARDLMGLTAGSPSPRRDAVEIPGGDAVEIAETPPYREN